LCGIFSIYQKQKQSKSTRIKKWFKKIVSSNLPLYPTIQLIAPNRLMDLPAGVSSLEIRITAHRGAAVYMNGQPVSGTGSDPKVIPGGLCAALDNIVFNVPDR
jgi:hypothetical protein